MGKKYKAKDKAQRSARPSTVIVPTALRGLPSEPESKAPATEPIMQTAQQRRAKYALIMVEKANGDGVSQKEYKSYASGFPAMIQMNGLGQAAAFYRSKGAEKTPKGIAYRSLYDLLSRWLTQADQPYAAYDDLLTGITKGNMRTYILAQAEALALLDWVKKFSKAYMGV